LRTQENFVKSTHSAALAIAIAISLPAARVLAVNDVLKLVLDQAHTVGVGGPTPSTIGAFSYDPVNDRFIVVGFSGANQDIRIVSNASTTQDVTRLVQATAYLMFTRDGDLNRTGGSPTPGGIVFNPQPIGAIPAYSAAFLTDGAAIVKSGTTNLPAISQRAYRYNLALDTNGDARDEMTSLITLEGLQNVQTPAQTSTSSNFSRQPAFSSDGQSLYYTDSSAAFGGLYRQAATGGTITRVLPDAEGLISESAVINTNGSDRVYIQGTLASPQAGGNSGGIDYFDTADNSRHVRVANTAIAAFLQTNVTDVDVRSFATDTAGNLYFNEVDSAPERRGVYRLDTEGRMIKVLSQGERIETFGGNPNSNTLRMQSRTVNFTPAGGGPAFPVTQLLYEETTGNLGIAGAYVFKAGDFNRDNDVTSADFDLFETALTLKGVAATVPNYKYDANGNNTVDYNDVKILQRFAGFLDGDANFDFAVNFADLIVLAQNYNLSAKKWTEGDFTGDELVDFADLIPLAQNYQSNPLLTGLPGGESFAADWALAQSLVPEPTSMLALATGVVAFGRRRRHA
jgi:hypothetical protein